MKSPFDLTPGGILLPHQRTSEDDAADAKDAENLARYENEPQIREIADRIHSARMMAGPACSQCIAAAISRLAVVEDDSYPIGSSDDDASDY